VLAVLGISALLAVISVIVPLSRRLMLPYTLVLAVVGVGIGSLSYLKLSFTGLGGDIVGGLNEMGLLDDTFIYVYLPPLLFSAGLNVDIRHIMEDISHVALLAVVAVIACTLIVGYGVHLSSGIALVPCLLFGTIVSTTDTAAVVNIFREVGAPKRLGAIVEGEALFNDAAAIAMFGLFLDMTANGSSFDFFIACRGFLLALLGGAAFGFVLARACGWLIASLRDSVTTEVTLTIALAYISFVIGNEVLGISGVVATVVSAIVISSVGRTRVSPGAWEILKSVWEHLDFWATCLIFVTSAMYVPKALGSFTWIDVLNVAVVFVAALLARGAILWGMMPSFSAMGASKPLSHGFKLVLWWGGMRGAVTIALALATAATPGVSPAVSHMVVSTSIGYVMATLMINGLTLRPLMNYLALDKLGEHDKAIRHRIFSLARRRIIKDLEGVASHIGHNTEDLVRLVIPMSKKTMRFGDLANDRKQHVALDTWCHHEHEAILMARERGVISRRNADVMMHNADQLQTALKSNGVDGYKKEMVRISTPPAILRLGFFTHRTMGWSGPLGSVVADRIALLLGQTVLIKELMSQAEDAAEKLFGTEAASMLQQVLEARLLLISDEVHSMERVFPDFTKAMHERHIALTMLGLLETEFRRHLSEATISYEVFEDLDTERRTVAVQYAKRPKLNLRKKSTRSTVMPVLHRVGAAREETNTAPYRSYLAYPGERIDLLTRRAKTFYILAGNIDVHAPNGKVRLEEGTFVSAKPTFEGCEPFDIIEASGYAHLIIFKSPRIKRQSHRYAFDNDQKAASPANDPSRKKRQHRNNSAA
jgi:CPA1 family monovalent cation:H+ antiporter